MCSAALRGLGSLSKSPCCTLALGAVPRTQQGLSKCLLSELKAPLVHTGVYRGRCDVGKMAFGDSGTWQDREDRNRHRRDLVALEAGSRTRQIKV